MNNSVSLCYTQVHKKKLCTQDDISKTNSICIEFEKKEIVLNIDKIFYGHVHRATEYMTMMMKMAKYINSI